MAWVLLLVFFFFFWSLFGFWPPLVVHEKKILGTFVWMHFVNARRKVERVFAVPNFPPRRVFAVSTFLPSVRENEFLQFQLFRQEEFLQFQLFYLWREKRVFAVSTSMPLVQARKKKKYSSKWLDCRLLRILILGRWMEGRMEGTWPHPLVGFSGGEFIVF